jgi:Tol biopolymer transport system component
VEIMIASHARTPSPSPDGSKFAYVEEFTNQIRVFDVATRTPSTWSVAGNGPAWSPDGSQIAYATPANTIAIVTPAGAPVRTLPASAGAVVIHGWSPDGKWLLNGGALIDAVTGEVLPLQYRTSITVTSFK